MSGVFISGHVRSGTSMTAGLFRAHGVFFGDCGGAVPDNPGGRLENRWLKQTMHAERWSGWPETWFRRLEAEGWDGESPWGAKLMPKWWRLMKETDPDVVVLCYRPEEDILASCERVGWKRSTETVAQRWAAMDEIRAEASGAVVRVDTPRLVSGDYGQVTEAFDALGMDFFEGRAREWIEPEWFHAG